MRIWANHWARNSNPLAPTSLPWVYSFKVNLTTEKNARAPNLVLIGLEI
jgi:hypothetical protein